MILTGWHVEGFGALAGWRVEGLAPGLTVVFGLNEAGKTTLRDFLRFVLFGRHRHELLREPDRGGRCGGRVFLQDEEGRPWVLERYWAPRRFALRDPEGRELPEAEWVRVAGGADGWLFRSVFAFGLEELSRLETLADPEVRLRLFSAGITGAGTQVERARRALESRLQQLYRPRAGGRIPQLREELQRARQELARAREAAAEYRRWLREEEEAQAQLRRLEEEIQRLQALREFYRTLRELWPLWSEYCAAREEAQAEAPWEAEALALAAELPLQRQRLQELEDAEERVRAGFRQLRLLLEQLGPGFSRQRVRQVALPATAIQELDRWRRELEEAELRYREAERAAQEAEAQKEEAERQRQVQEQACAQAQAYPAWEEVAARHRALADLERHLTAWRPRLAGARMAGAAAAALALLGAVARAWGWNGWPTLAVLAAAAALAALGAGLACRAPRAAVRALARRLDLPDPPLPSHLEAARVRLRGEEEQARARQAAEERWREACAAAEAARQRWLQALARARQAREERDRLRAAWQARREELGLPASLDPEGAHTFAVLLQAAREKEADLSAAEEAAERLARQAEAWRQRARAVLAAAGVPGARGDDAGLLEQVEALARRAEQARQARQRLQEREKALRLCLGEGEEADRYRQELERGSRAAWEAQLAELEDALARLQAERDAVLQRRRDAERARQELESSADVPSAAARVHALEAELGEAVRQWQVDRLALALLERALDAYLHQRQAEVLQVASRVVERVTRRRYVGVYQEGEPSRPELGVVDAEGRRWAPERLSRGTVELLYLALRLGLACSFARRGVALPLVMDDVLVNLDPLRSQRMLEALEAYLEGPSRQVLLLTCHPETVRRARRAFPSCRVVLLAAARD